MTTWTQIRNLRRNTFTTITHLDPSKTMFSTLVDIRGESYDVVVDRVPFSTGSFVWFEECSFAFETTAVVGRRGRDGVG